MCKRDLSMEKRGEEKKVEGERKERRETRCIVMPINGYTIGTKELFADSHFPQTKQTTRGRLESDSSDHVAGINYKPNGAAVRCDLSREKRRKNANGLCLA